MPAKRFSGAYYHIMPGNAFRSTSAFSQQLHRRREHAPAVRLQRN